MMFLLIALLFSIFTTTIHCSNLSGYNETIEKERFKEFFEKIYQLRIANETANSNNSSTSHSIQRRSSPKGRNVLVDLYDAYKLKSKVENWKKIPDGEVLHKQTQDLIVEKMWDRLGGKFVRKTFITVGERGGTIVGGFAGASLGVVLAAATGNPLFVVGGVFIGQRFGKEVMALAGAIVADYVNNFIVHNIISDSMLQPSVQNLTNFLHDTSTSEEVTCRSDICLIGSAERECQCVRCDGPMQYSDTNGAALCKTCKLGTLAIGTTKCEGCRTGTFGTNEGKCYNCKIMGPMRYGDVEGLAVCKTCSLGTVPWYTPFILGGLPMFCNPCGLGTIGKSDGKCYSCKDEGPMKYVDFKGASVCKTCPLGSFAASDLFVLPYPNLCRKCEKGTIGKNDGKCYTCKSSNPMTYNDIEGATSCKICELGTIPLYSFNRPVGCKKCPKGTFGKTDGKCHNCRLQGPMKYSDTESGNPICKTCRLGTFPHYDYRYGYRPVRCNKCPEGTFGKNDGKCYECKDEGPMKYSDEEGSPACKNCELGTGPYLLRGAYSAYSCEECSDGMFGKNDGKCHNCKTEGPMKYIDTDGAKVCKTCQLGTIPVYRSSIVWTHLRVFERQNRPVRCNSCRKGTFGKSDGDCHKCVGQMSYSDTYGATFCKTCDVGYYSKPDPWGYKIQCTGCPYGTVGTATGCLSPDQVTKTPSTEATTRSFTSETTIIQTTEHSSLSSTEKGAQPFTTKTTKHTTPSETPSQPAFTKTTKQRTPSETSTQPEATHQVVTETTKRSNNTGNHRAQQSSATSWDPLRHYLITWAMILISLLLWF